MTDDPKDCRVTHAPGQSYVCWTHRHFLPWSKPVPMWSGCSCDWHGYERQQGQEARRD